MKRKLLTGFLFYWLNGAYVIKNSTEGAIHKNAGFCGKADGLFS